MAKSYGERRRVLALGVPNVQYRRFLIPDLRCSGVEIDGDGVCVFARVCVLAREKDRQRHGSGAREGEKVNGRYRYTIGRV